MKYFYIILVNNDVIYSQSGIYKQSVWTGNLSERSQSWL